MHRRSRASEILEGQAKPVGEHISRSGRGGTQSWWAPISDPADPFQIWSVFSGLVRARGRPLLPLNSSLGFGWFFYSEQFSISSAESLRVSGA
ncbi:hypothetical protein Bca4012_071833 [Brassica carinata]